ncbi:unnamed protein product, partial [Effrenium voratum]
VKVLYGKVIIRERPGPEIKDGKMMEDVAQKELLALLEGGRGYLLRQMLIGKVGIIAGVRVGRRSSRHRFKGGQMAAGRPVEVLWDRLNGLKSQQAVDVEGLRRRIMKEAEEAFQLKLNRPSQAGGSHTDS